MAQMSRSLRAEIKKETKTISQETTLANVNMVWDISSVSPSDQPGFALKFFHLDVKSHGTSVLLEADRGALAACKDIQCYPEVLHILGNPWQSLAIVSTQKVVPVLQ
jgi:hypothetical protein